MSWRATGLLVWTAAWYGLPAEAQRAERPALHWSRGPEAESCIDPSTLSRHVTTLAGPVLVDPTRADLIIEGNVHRDARGAFQVHIRAGGRAGEIRGERTLSTQDGCRSLDVAIAFVIAVMIDPDLALEELPASLVALGAEGPLPEQRLLEELEREPPGAQAPFVSDEAEQPPKPSPKPAPSDPVPQPLRRVEVLAGATIGPRELPKTALGFHVAIDVLPVRWLALEAQVRGILMTSSLALDGRKFLNATSLTGAVLLCPRNTTSFEAMFFEGCFGVEALATRVRANDVVALESSPLFTLAGQLGIGIGAHVTDRVAVRARAFGRVTQDRPAFVYEVESTRVQAFQLPRFSGGINLGLHFAF